MVVPGEAVLTWAVRSCQRRSTMRLTHLLTVPAAAGAIILLGMSSASAGEINGTGNPPGGRGLGASHAASVCAFSGLEDGDGAGFPGPGGAPPQNWGHVKQG